MRFFALFLLLFIGRLQAQVVVHIEQVSSSGELFIVGLGQSDGLFFPDHCALYSISEDNKQARKVVDATLKRLTRTQSVWQINNGSAEDIKNRPILFVTSSIALNGRKMDEYSEKDLVADFNLDSENIENELNEKIENSEQGFPNHLVIDKRFHAEIAIHKTKSPHDADLEGVTLNYWEKNAKGENEANQLVRAPSQSKVEEKSRSEKQMAIEKMLSEQWVDKNLVKRKNKQQNFHAAQSEELVSAQKSQFAGMDWSKDMQEDELRDYVKGQSVQIEKQRQAVLYDQSIDHEVSFLFNTNLVDNTSVEDTDGGDSSAGFGFQYEYYMARHGQKWRRNTLVGNYQRDEQTYDMGNFGALNAKSRESVWRIFWRHYLVNSPDRASGFSVYSGIGIGNGESDVKKDEYEGDFSIFIFPSLEIGLKYKDEKKELDGKEWGVVYFAGLNYERVSMKADYNPSGAFADSVNMNHLKLNLGLGVHF